MQNVGQMVFAYVLIQRWIIHPYIYIDSFMVLVLPPYYAKIFNSCKMTCGVTLVINGGESLQMFFGPFAKCSC